MRTLAIVCRGAILASLAVPLLPVAAWGQATVSHSCGGGLGWRSAAAAEVSGEKSGDLASALGAPALPLLVIRADTSDRPGQPISSSSALSQAEFANDFFTVQSYGAFSYPSITVTPLLRLTKSAVYYESLPYPYLVLEALVDGKAAAERAGYDLAHFGGYVLYHTPFAGWSAGTGPPDGSLINGSGYPLLLAHEIGHTSFAFPHAGTPGDPTGDHYDVMGYAPRIEPQTVNVCFKRHAGWIGASRIHDVATTGTYRLQEHSDAPLGAGRVAIQVRKDDTTDYWVELRQDLPGDPAVFGGVVIHRCPVGPMSPATPGSELVAITQIGSTFTDAAADLEITPLAKVGSSPEAVDVLVEIGPGAPPPAPLAVTAPNGGDIWGIGFPATVTWRTTGPVGSLTIELSTNGGGSWTTLVASTPNDGSHTLTVPATATSQARIRVREPDGSPSDVSNAHFTILPGPTLPAITVLAPNGGESWSAGQQRTVAWDSAGWVGNVAIELSTNGGGSWTTLVPLTADDGAESITVPAAPSSQCRIRVRDVHDAASDLSNGNFTISSGPGPTPSPSPSPSPTPPPGSTIAIRAKSLTMKDGVLAGDPSRRRLGFRSASHRGSPSGVVAPPFFGPGDPVANGATLVVYNANGSGEQAVVALPAAGWTHFGSPSRRFGYRYADPAGLLGPISAVKLDSRGTLSISGRGPLLAYTLDEPSQGAVALRLGFGATPAFCAVSPARSSGSPPTTATHDRIDRFVGERNAAPPATCPPVP